MKTLLYTVLALLAFAGNSVLCRLALGDNVIDPTSFTVIRLFSGVFVLLLILKIMQSNSSSLLPLQATTKTNQSKGSWAAGLMLFVYALTFSFAYQFLETGMGALILFGSVQITMVLISLLSGNKISTLEWLGLIMAFLGFIYLFLPSLETPPLLGSLLMIVSGIAWGLYTLSGKKTQNPLADTTYNFIRTVPLCFILLAVMFREPALTSQGIILAILSGALASGIGYTIWYTALKELSAIQAASSQLLVPIIAAIGGVIFANEDLSLRLIITSLMILGGILIIVLGKQYDLIENRHKKGR